MKRILFIFFLFIFSLLLHDSVNAQTINDSQCISGPRIIYVRGSGEDVNSTNYDIFKSNLDKIGVSYNITELTENENGKYDPISVSGSPFAFLIGGVTVISEGGLNKYKNSVNSGVRALESEILKHDCVILVGYSQGAQVVGQYLSEMTDDAVKSRIIYVGLMGDPKFDSVGYDIQIPGSKASWYRGDSVLGKHNGTLSPRRPYIPKDISEVNTFTTVGSWCYKDDPICTSYYLPDDNAHGKYGERAIPQMAMEIANVINEHTRPGEYMPVLCPYPQDIVLAVNVSDSVRKDAIFLSSAGVNKIVNGIYEGNSGCDIRTGLVVFGEDNKDPVMPIANLDHGSSNRMKTPLESYWNPDSSGDPIPVKASNVTEAIDASLDMNWREGAQKTILVFSDSPDEQYVTYNVDQFDVDATVALPDVKKLVKRSREIGGVEISAVNIYHNESQDFQLQTNNIGFYTYIDRIVRSTGGRFIERTNCNHCTWLNMSFSIEQIIGRRPDVTVAPISMRVGETITLNAVDASAGYAGMLEDHGMYASYGWTLDCDAPSAHGQVGNGSTYTPTKPASCYGAVGVTYISNGFCITCYDSSTASPRKMTTFKVDVYPEDYIPLPVPGQIRNFKQNRDWENNAIKYTWDAPANAEEIGEMAYIIKDSDGNIVGITRRPQVIVTDVPDDQQLVLSITAAGESGQGILSPSSAATDTSRPKPSGTLESLTKTDIRALNRPSSIIGVPIENISEIHNDQTAQNTANQPLNMFGLPNNSPRKPDYPSTQSNSGDSLLLMLTVIAVPLAAVTALGIAAKYGLLLRLFK